MSYYPPKKNTEYITYIALPSQANGAIAQANPTIAAGDFKVSTDGGALGNLGTLPAVTPASSKMVKVTLSASEMNGDNVTLVASDAAGNEWCDVIINFQTAVRQVDDLAFPTTTGRSIDVTAGGTVGIDWSNVEAPTTVLGLSGTTIKTATDVETDTADIQTQIGAAGAGLTAINLPDQTMNITGDITGNLSGSVGSVTGAVGSVTGAVGSVTGAVGSVTGAVGSVTGLTASDVGAIKAKTDSLTFTVAGQADANIQSVNDVTVTGNGQVGTEWGP